ncbi:hypothetical protein MNBD_GAMMA18-55 [hydrothermal vent metagenome]|uniref:Uncharacterized protein n=1 Tax=hydrothermal vent metagenome TaxID=652676 RepID=A0A3B0ZNC7_9ZZZZ
MADKKRPTKGECSKELEELRKYGNKAAKGLFSSKESSSFDENELASGNTDLLEKTDAELFPDEVDEYTKEERKPRIIVDNSSKDPSG